MKKATFLLIAFASIALFQSCTKCTKGKPTIPINTVRAYMTNYRQLIAHYGDSAALQWVGLTKDQINCLSEGFDSVKLIVGSTDSTNINKLMAIVELCSDSCRFYEANSLFKGQNVNFELMKICPPPTPCGIP